MIEDFLVAVTNYGFPVVVAGYLLFRFEKKIEKLTEAIGGSNGMIVNIKKNRETINILNKTVEKLIDKK